MKKLRDKIKLVVSAKTNRFDELVKIAGLDPTVHFRNANLCGVNFAGSELENFDFTGADVSGCDFRGANYINALFDFVIYDDSTVFSDTFSASEFLSRFLDTHNRSKISVFTPDGDEVRLPVGSTVLDFAYYIHSEIGARAVRARVDGKLARLSDQLQDGQVVKVEHDDSQAPSKKQLGVVTTRRAKEYLKRALRDQEQIRNIERGKNKFEAYFRKLNPRRRELILSALGDRHGFFDELTAVYGGLGAGTLRIEDVLLSAVSRGVPKTERVIVGVGNFTDVSLCRECSPMPFTRIVGISLKKNRGLRVHAIDCPRLAEFEEEPDRWIDLRWNSKATKLV